MKNIVPKLLLAAAALSAVALFAQTAVKTSQRPRLTYPTPNSLVELADPTPRAGAPNGTNYSILASDLRGFTNFAIGVNTFELDSPLNGNQFLGITSDGLTIWDPVSGNQQMTFDDNAGTWIHNPYGNGAGLTNLNAAQLTGVTPNIGIGTATVTNLLINSTNAAFVKTDGNGKLTDGTALPMSSLDNSTTTALVTNAVALKWPVFTNAGVTYYILLVTNVP